MATLNECIGHYKNARKAVKEGKAIVATNELYDFLQIVAYAAQDAAPFDKEIFTHVFNSYLPIYHELKTRGITESVNNALCISISEVFKINDDRLPPIIPADKRLNDESIVVPPVVEDDHKDEEDVTDKHSDTTISDIPPVVIPTDVAESDKSTKRDDSIAVNKHIKKSGLRPETFEDFIGQKQAVSRLKTAIAVAKMDGKHCIADKGGILFKGTTGLGKTTLMRIVANELGVEFKEFNTATLQASTKSQSSFEDFIENIAKKNVPVVIGMDEIHMIPSAQETMLLTLLEDRVYKKIGNGEDIVLKMPEFTFIGATTDADKLSSAHRGRYQKGLVLELVDYTPEEWREIVIQKFSVYGLQVTEGAVKEVVGRSRSSVRDVEGYVEHIYQKARIAHITQLDEEIIKKHFADEGIEPNGLYSVDVKILEALEDARDYTLSEENLCSKVNIGIGSFREERKPFLVRIGYIESYSKGQKLTSKALEFLRTRKNPQVEGNIKSPKEELISKNDTLDIHNDNTTQSAEQMRSDLVSEVSAEDVLKLLTGKFTKMTVEKDILCEELHIDMAKLNILIEQLHSDRLVNIKPLGIIATIDAYKKLNIPFDPLE